MSAMNEADHQRILEAKNLKKSFKRRPAVADVSLRVQPGEVVGLLGPNGAGKTTTFKMILGLIRKDGGEVRFGEVIDALPLYKRARLGLGYLPQGPSVFRGLSVEDNLIGILEAIRKPYPRERTRALLERFNLTALKKQKAKTLSGGERRRLEFARALCSDPTILLCDEPFAGIDPIATADITTCIEDLRNDNVGVLLTDHSVKDALGVCDRVYLVVDGSVLEEGTPEAVLKSAAARRLYFGDRFECTGDACVALREGGRDDKRR